MTAAQPTFGEFLAAARGHVTAGAASGSVSVTPGRDTEERLHGLLRVVTVLTRLTADINQPIGQLPNPELARIGVWDRAGLHAHDALVSATAALRRDRSGLGPARGNPLDQRAQRLNAAARALAAGRDLLRGHFITDASGAQHHHSGWALAITSPAVRRTLLREIASLGGQAAIACAPAVVPGPDTRLADMRGRLDAALHWLEQADAAVSAAERREPTTLGERELLYAIPVNAMPDRSAPGATGSVQELCEAMITAAERARHAAWSAARVAPQSPAISVTSWYRIAAASTAASHHCYILLATLSGRLAQDPAGRSSRSELLSAAELAGQAREEWLDSAREFQEITTDIRGYISPAAAEAGELALWTGKLAYADPEWILTSGPGQPVRPAADLARRQADMPGVVAAIHHASEALSCLAAANLDQARSAIHARRILVSTKSLPESYDVPMPFAEAPESYVTSLLMCCQDTAGAAARAADAAAEIATSVGAPSRPLAVARAVGREQHVGRLHDVPPAVVLAGGDGDQGAAGPVETRLRDLGVTSPRLLGRASAVDQAGQQVIADATLDLAQRQQRRATVAVAQHRGQGRQRTSAGRRTRSAGRILPSAAPAEQLEAEP